MTFELHGASFLYRHLRDLSTSHVSGTRLGHDLSAYSVVVRRVFGGCDTRDVIHSWVVRRVSVVIVTTNRRTGNQTNTTVIDWWFFISRCWCGGWSLSRFRFRCGWQATRWILFAASDTRRLDSAAAEVVSAETTDGGDESTADGGIQAEADVEAGTSERSRHGDAKRRHSNNIPKNKTPLELT